MPFFIDTRPYYSRVEAVRITTGLPIKLLTGLCTAAALLAGLVSVIFAVSAAFIGLTLLLSALAAAGVLIQVFGRTYYPYLPTPRSVQQVQQETGKVNIAQAVSFELLRILGRTPRLHTPAVLAALVHRTLSAPVVHIFLRRLQLPSDRLWQTMQSVLLPQLTEADWCTGMLAAAEQTREETLHAEHALAALLLHPAMKTSLREINFTEDDIAFVLWWSVTERRQQAAARRWWTAEHLSAQRGIGLSWAAGYTPFVDQFARLPSGSVWDQILIGHESKLAELINVLARQRQSNVLVVGDPGVGRIGIIRELAHRIDRNAAHPALNGQRLLYINIGELLAYSSSDAGQLTIVNRALREMERAGNIIAVIDGLSAILGSGGSDRRANLTDIIVPFLSAATIRVVVLLATEEYHLRVKSNQELMQYFDVVQVPSLSVTATMERIALTARGIEQAGRIVLPYSTIRAVVQDTASIYPHVPFPERAYDFLEEAIVLAQSQGKTVVNPEHVYTLIEQKVGMNIGRLREGERERLLSLEERMHQRLVNQETAVSTLARALLRARTEVRTAKRPIGSFLFLGPTGVGKTETAKTLAEVYFGSENNMIRLDMSEFQGTDAVSRLIGSPGQPVGRLTAAIGDRPFAVVLLDEFEKAAEAVHQLFLQVLDEGHLTDVAGRQYSFLHAIIIATSNAGAELIREQIMDGRVPPNFERTLREHILSTNILRPELVNRFDAVVTYTPLSAGHIRQVAQLMLRSLNQRLDHEHGITVAITDELVEYLVSIGYDPEFGARPMARAIQDTVEYAVAQRLLRGGAEPGQQIIFSQAELQAQRQ
ncbi:MAG: hypothetical protein COT71_01465 [Candidatus Andersenbacteria bacterium CG10_big_fil_rev_8_21_14_0_10_54_11]|uniref:Clp R domain-containing protein n=1 Tax=Candidatus Andersenbacteria bacterium CG10_big_fil_rev_8_21_14_0_10_54_11 TaxID=1974485 RepID=A0A2M6WZX5_9BACT|nr:MAG: hypothetical protein COT71_01465 [Candidatus Andersenbacteria bacterium CG10_big_fil_rev_8_21_14_0_10_54_11]